MKVSSSPVAEAPVGLEAYWRDMAARISDLHRHVWVRDDRPGWREYVCLACGLVLGVKETSDDD